MAQDTNKEQTVKNLQVAHRLNDSRFEKDVVLAKACVPDLAEDELLAAVAEMAIVAYMPDSFDRERHLEELGIGTLSELSESQLRSFALRFFDDIRRDRLDNFGELPYNQRKRIEREVNQMVKLIEQAKEQGDRKPLYQLCKTNLAINDRAVWIFCKLFEALAPYTLGQTLGSLISGDRPSEPVQLITENQKSGGQEHLENGGYFLKVLPKGQSLTFLQALVTFYDKPTPIEKSIKVIWPEGVTEKGQKPENGNIRKVKLTLTKDCPELRPFIVSVKGSPGSYKLTGLNASQVEELRRVTRS